MGKADSRLTSEQMRRAVATLSRRDADLAAIARDHGRPPLWLRRPGFATLTRIILEQQVSLASGAAAYVRLSNGVGRVTPGNVLARSEAQLRRFGLTRQKARYCRELATAVTSGGLELSRLASVSSDEVRESLIRVPGIGRWTADVYLLIALGRPDVWPRGDLALYQSMRSVLGCDSDSETLDAYADRWQPWRAVAARLLWHRYLRVRRR